MNTFSKAMILMLILSVFQNCSSDVEKCEYENELGVLNLGCNMIVFGNSSSNPDFNLAAAAYSCLEAKKIREKCREKGRVDGYFK